MPRPISPSTRSADDDRNIVKAAVSGADPQPSGTAVLPENAAPLADRAPVPQASVPNRAAGAPAGTEADSLPPNPRPSWRSILTQLVILALLAVGGWGGWHTREQWWPQVDAFLHPKPVKSSKGQPRVVTVVTAPVTTRDVELTLSGLGTVTALNTVTVRSRVEGELTQVYFTEGQMVHAGDLLAEIDPRTWRAQLDQAEGQLARDEATLKAAEATLARYRQLQQANIISAQQVDDQFALVQQASAAIKSDQAAIANAQLQLDFCKITAPITGRIGLRLVDPGNIVRATDATGLAIITQLQPISVVFTIPQDDIHRVQKRSRSQAAPLIVEAFDRDFQNQLATGELLALDNQVDPTTGTVRLKALFRNDEELLFPNQFVNARLKVETIAEALVVPAAAVQRGPQAEFVYVLQSDSTVAVRPVEIGPTEQSDVVISAGLQPGERVVVEGTDRLQPGAKVATRDRLQPSRGGSTGTADAKPALATGDKPTTSGDSPASRTPAPGADPRHQSVAGSRDVPGPENPRVSNAKPATAPAGSDGSDSSPRSSVKVSD